MSRIAREKKTVGMMIAIYCHKHHQCNDGLCTECSSLLNYAHARLEHCKFGEKKGTCRKCSVHCYKPTMRDEMRKVMRYSGPRMLWHHPIAAIRHLIDESHNP